MHGEHRNPFAARIAKAFPHQDWPVAPTTVDEPGKDPDSASQSHPQSLRFEIYVEAGTHIQESGLVQERLGKKISDVEWGAFQV